MSEEHGTLEAFGVIFLCWAAVFFGVWVFPLADMGKITLDIFSSVIFIMFGVVYFMLKGKIPFPNPEMRRKIGFWYNIVMLSLFAAIAFWFSYFLWEFVTINGVEVVTLRDLVALLYGIMGVSLVVFVIRYVNNKNPYKKTRKLKTVN
jgi:hypothetical protein